MLAYLLIPLLLVSALLYILVYFNIKLMHLTSAFANKHVCTLAIPAQLPFTSIFWLCCLLIVLYNVFHTYIALKSQKILSLRRM